jgi:hypothetical protein
VAAAWLPRGGGLCQLGVVVRVHELSGDSKVKGERRRERDDFN